MGSEPHQERSLVGADDIRMLPFSSDKNMDLSMFIFIVYIHCSGPNGSFKTPERTDSGTYTGNLAVHIGTKADPDSMKDHFTQLKGSWWITGHIHEAVLLHEIGHLFGLGHSNTRSVMSRKKENVTSVKSHAGLFPDYKCLPATPKNPGGCLIWW